MKSRAQQIKYIALHCSAGFGDIAAMQKFWRSQGWKTDGYHIVIDLNGVPHNLVPLDHDSNGVKGYNGQTINICYIGGVEVVKDAKGNKTYKGKDTRTEAQKIAQDNAIVTVVEWLRANGNDCTDVMILGHRDFSPDQNGNGVIESWERIKECPSHDTINEKKALQEALTGSKKMLIPSKRK